MPIDITSPITTARYAPFLTLSRTHSCAPPIFFFPLHIFSPTSSHCRRRCCCCCDIYVLFLHLIHVWLTGKKNRMKFNLWKDVFDHSGKVHIYSISRIKGIVRNSSYGSGRVFSK